jgi:Polyketide cyclase / dehydrase and lipid transport
VRVDVLTEIDISRPRSVVAEYASNLDHTTEWYTNIERIDWKSPKPLRVGSQVAFVARFLGKRLAYTYEVRDWAPGQRLVMSTTDGPFPMETTYEWRDSPSGGTTMALRNRGTPAGFSNVAAPMMVGAMRRANRQDLARIKAILEAPDLAR